MEIFNKISSRQLYLLWRNFSIGILSIVLVMSLIKLLPVNFAPFISLLCSAYLYYLVSKNRKSVESSCLIIPYALMFCMIGFSFVLILFNALYAFDLIYIDPEFVYFHRPFVPILFLAPVSVVVISIIYFRKDKLSLCIDCKSVHGSKFDRGTIRNIFDHESHLQLRNTLIIFVIISIITWVYFHILYIDININERDSYVFTWLIVLIFIFEEVFFAVRYYNLYLDLKDNNEIISEEELYDLSAQTFLRIYVICGNYLYVQNEIDEVSQKEIIDTPFFSRRSVNGITFAEVKRIITKRTGVKDGELRFFYGRIVQDLTKLHLLRYFYFLDGTIKDYPTLKTEGRWIDYNELQHIYMSSPSKLSPITLIDTSRLATIIVTEKIFDENGYRKSKIKHYKPSFNLIDVRNSNLDFQDDKWIRISLFNSDSRFYRIRKWWRNMIGNANRVKKVTQDN